MTGKILHIYSDANSCYDKAFERLNIAESHTMTKTQTHLIESSNSSIRDNLARFNRKTTTIQKNYEKKKSGRTPYIYEAALQDA